MQTQAEYEAQATSGLWARIYAITDYFVPAAHLALR